MTKYNKIIDEEKNEWEGQQVETEQVALSNDGTGKSVIVRVFDFTLPPMENPQDIDERELLRAHKSKLTAFLWRDELVPVQDFKIVLAKDFHSFKIFATCQAKPGSVILEKPELLQNIMNGQN